MLRFISGRGGAELPEHVAVMSSGFDRLGLVYTPVAGEDPFASRRAEFRALASGLAGLGGGETGAAQEWMRERELDVAPLKPAPVSHPADRGCPLGKKCFNATG